MLKMDSFTKECPVNQTGSVVQFSKTYTGTATSSISVEDASNKAYQNALLASSSFEEEGQNYANSVGTCTPINNNPENPQNPVNRNFEIVLETNGSGSLTEKANEKLREFVRNNPSFVNSSARPTNIDPALLTFSRTNKVTQWDYIHIYKYQNGDIAEFPSIVTTSRTPPDISTVRANPNFTFHSTFSNGDVSYFPSFTLSMPREEYVRTVLKVWERTNETGGKDTITLIYKVCETAYLTIVDFAETPSIESGTVTLGVRNIVEETLGQLRYNRDNRNYYVKGKVLIPDVYALYERIESSFMSLATEFYKKKYKTDVVPELMYDSSGIRDTSGQGNIDGIAFNNISLSCRAVNPNTYQDEANVSISIGCVGFDLGQDPAFDQLYNSY
jgi:hypothetical protein